MEIKQNQKTVNTNATTPGTTGDQSYAGDIYSLWGDLETSMSVGADTTQIYSAMMETGKATIADLAQRGVEVKSGIILSNSNGNSVLAFDTIVVAMRHRESVAIATFIMKDNVILLKDEVPVVQYDAALNPTMYEDTVQVPRFASEADDEVYRGVVSEFVSNLFADQPRINLYMLSPKVWYPAVLESAEDGYLQTELKYALQNAIQRLSPSWANPSSCRSLKNMFSGNNRGMDVVLGGYHGDSAVALTDELGRLSVPTASVAVRLMTQGTASNTTMHRGGKTIDIGTLGLRTEVLWVGSPYHQPNTPPPFISPGAANTHGFAPSIIVEDFHQKSPRLEDVLITLGVTYTMMTEAVVKSSFDAATLGVLNISSNVLAHDAPKPLSAKVMNGEFDSIYGQFMRPGAVNFSMVLRPGSHGVNTTQYFNNKDADNEAILRTALDNATDGAFSASYTGNILQGGEPEPYLVGTYPAENGATRPLSEIGLLQVMVMGHQNLEAVRYWIDSQSENVDRKTSIALKLKCLEKLGINYVLDEVYTLVSLNVGVLAWLGDYIKNNQLIQSSNINQFNNATSAGWGTNRMANTMGNYFGAVAQAGPGMSGGMQLVNGPQGPSWFDVNTGMYYPMQPMQAQPVAPAPKGKR